MLAITYNSACVSTTLANVVKNKLSVSGMTYFALPFAEMLKVVTNREYAKKDLAFTFMTDGEDTSNQPKQLDE